MAAQLGCPACCGHTGCTGTHNDHVKVLGLVRGDVAQLHHRGLHFLGGQAVGHHGLGLAGSVGATATPLAWLMQLSAAFLMAPEVMVAPEWPSTSLDCASRIFFTISSAMSAP